MNEESKVKPFQSNMHQQHHTGATNIYLDHMPPGDGVADESDKSNGLEVICNVNNDEYVSFEESETELVSTMRNAGTGSLSKIDEDDMGYRIKDFAGNPEFDNPLAGSHLNGKLVNNDNQRFANGEDVPNVNNGLVREKNYVYTYGHFTLEGRSREPSNA